MIKKTKFGFLSPKMIKDMSAVKIEHAELYDPDGYPIDGGLTDLRLGVVDPGLICRTCGGRIGQCLGHFGYLELTKPVIHPLYGKKIYMLLRAMCYECGRILLDEKEVKKIKSPLKELYKMNPKKCPHCGVKQLNLKFQKPTTFLDGNKELTSEEIRQMLERISDSDLKLLGVDGGRPEWFVLTLLPIPPVTVRPSITLETGERSEDDLTHKLVDVVRINERFRKNLELGAPDFIIADIWELLQYHISTLMDNETPSLPPARHRSGRALKTFVQRLSKKQGRFRGNLSGKRVNFSARTVISPDPMISLNEVGVPLEIAKELTVPVKVTRKNLKQMKELVLQGPDNHPGANYIFRSDGVRKKITTENKKEIAEELDVGYIIERHLQDGDISIFNRQPSLHRMSMMAHKVKVMPYKTFRLNLLVTIPYNADFDGDEMNLHIPQKIEAQTEAKMLMLAEKNIRSPRYGAPIIACKQDHLTGSYLLTRNEAVFSKKEAYELMASIDKIELLGDAPSYTGKELFSLLLPKGLNISFKSATCNGCTKCEEEGCKEDAYVVIKDGKLIKGVIDENALGERKGRLISAIERDYGTEVCGEFLDNISRLSLEMITRKGFSISVSEQDISSSAKKAIKKILEDFDERITGLLKKDDANVEDRIQQFTGEVTNKVSEIIKTDLPFNNAVIMARTGARGSFVNLTQMCGFVGQETLEGERINRGYTNRTLSHFPNFDKSLRGKGFVFEGYKESLNPFGFFFDAMNSRENLMDKSLHTRHSGYMERRIVTALQDLYVQHDMTVRDSLGRIVQFKVGEDGVDPAKSENGRIEVE
jgi:DNA-directed RNA polymerase subunit A'